MNSKYDQVSRLTTQSLPDGGEKNFTYDNMNNVLTATSKVTVSQNYVVSYEYNKIYQVTQMIEDVGGLDITTQKTYDSLHRLASIIDAKTQTTAYEYDQENRLTKETYADSGIISRTYDLDGRITTKTDQNSDVVSYFYDDRDLLIEQDYGTAGVKLFTYDNLRRKTSESDNNSNSLLVSSSYTYDTLYRQLTSAQQIGSGTVMTDTKVYNAYGEVTEHTLASGKVIDYTYTALHQMDAIVSDVGNGTETLANYDYNYDTVNSDMRPLVKKKTLATGTDIHTDFAYDQMGRQVLNDSQNGSNVTIVGFEYAFNLIGNRLTDNHLHKSDESETYSYDTAQRFTNYERGIIGSSPVFTQGYTLDALANWSSFNNNGSTQSRTHDSMNAITAMGTQSVNYDVKGNQTSNINGNTYYWDKLNRLIEIKNISNATIALYYYNTDNLRVEKITAGSTEQYYYCGIRVCVETDGSQNVTKEYIHGGQYIDEIITIITGGDPYYYLYDLRFNMYALIDDSGNVVERARYEGFGKQELMDDSFVLVSVPLVDQPYSYTGQRLDLESGLQYYRARYFDNDMGRFINRDPIGYVDGLNLYQGYFVINGLDFNGLKDITITLVIHDPNEPKGNQATNADLKNCGDYIQHEARVNGQSGPIDSIKIYPKDPNLGGEATQNMISKVLKDKSAKPGDNVTIGIVYHGADPDLKTGVQGMLYPTHETNSAGEKLNYEIGSEVIPWENTTTTLPRMQSMPAVTTTRKGILPPNLLDDYNVRINLWGCFSWYTSCIPNRKDKNGNDLPWKRKQSLFGAKDLLNIEPSGQITRKKNLQGIELFPLEIMCQ